MIYPVDSVIHPLNNRGQIFYDVDMVGGEIEILIRVGVAIPVHGHFCAPVLIHVDASVRKG